MVLFLSTHMKKLLKETKRLRKGNIQEEKAGGVGERRENMSK